MNYPKYEQKLHDKVVEPSMRQAAQPGLAVVLSFNGYNNTCDIITALQGSDEFGEVYRGVAAPIQMGVQSAAPVPGTMCWVGFRDGTTTMPHITHFLSTKYSEFNFSKQYKAVNDTPRFLIAM